MARVHTASDRGPVSSRAVAGVAIVDAIESRHCSSASLEAARLLGSIQDLRAQALDRARSQGALDEVRLCLFAINIE